MSEADKQGCEWLRLYRRIKTLLKQHGKADYERGLEIADFLLVQDNWGGPLHQVEVHSLHMLQPAIVKSLQGLLRDYPEWEIVVRVDVPGKEDASPGMDLTIYADSICDALPAECQGLAYEGAVPLEGGQQIVVAIGHRTACIHGAPVLGIKSCN